MGVCCAADTASEPAHMDLGGLNKKPTLFGMHTADTSGEDSDIPLDGE